MIDPYKIIVRPVVTEKSYSQAHGTAWERKGKQEQVRWYSFEVVPSATKHQIREAIEQLFDVKVTGVNTCHVRPKYRRVRFRQGLTKRWKKAMVRVSPQSKAIEGF
jgi:large subunit ribosomal protein L23